MRPQGHAARSRPQGPCVVPATVRLGRASPCGPVWPCVALCGPVWPRVALWPGGERGPSAQWSRPAEARGSLEHDVALSTRDASGAPAGRGLSRLWFAPLLPLYYPLLAREQAPRASSRRPCASSCPRRRCSPPTTASRAMPARHPKTVNSTSVGRGQDSKFGFVFAPHRWVHYTPPPGTDDGRSAHRCAAREWTPQQPPL